MILERICAMLQSCTTDLSLFPPTELYNEGWLLRLVLDWFSTHSISRHPLDFFGDARWFSEAWLPSAFLRRQAGDPLAEAWTRADGVVGHFLIGSKGKADLSLLPTATQFVVLEAKLYSRLASGVTNATYFDQAARTAACMAEVLGRANRSPSQVPRLGFYVLAPDSQIRKGVFVEAMNRSSIQQKVEKRVQEYGEASEQWHSEWFQPTLKQIEIEVISWEELIAVVGEQESATAYTLGEFYQKCLEFNE